ncbi:hypothetical protein PHMEG_00027413 [Phytophthora megakarya]|uniref:BED-type domain-containing protein n=1 Tax=Phytophthora megakarya TaxID=4795 RepID=A0A225V9W7_9STRA|nr:hypothetical protein PHMEG_00027413 [Phytophthora megakarya]
MNRNITAYFFEGLGDSHFRCKSCGMARKQASGTGYSNLIGHLAAKHDVYHAVYDTATASQSLGTLGFFGCAGLYREIYLDNELTRAISCWKPISSKTLKKLMKYVTIKVGNALENELGGMFGLIFDWWSHASLHYVGIFAVYECNGQRRQPLLGVSLLDKGWQDADACIRLIANVLSVYNKTPEMVCFLVADNCVTNQSIATKLAVPLVVCTGHRFNLAAKQFYAEHEPILDAQRDPFVDDVCDGGALCTNARRDKKVEAVEEFIPTASKHHKLVKLYEDLKKLNSVCKHLDDTDMAQVRLLFDSGKAEYPVMSDYLKAGAKIVHSPVFESAIVKTINGQALTNAETKSLEAFKVTNPSIPKLR